MDTGCSESVAPAVIEAPWTGAPCRLSVHGLNTVFFECIHSSCQRETDGVRAFGRASPIMFSPCTLRRRWGTRPGDDNGSGTVGVAALARAPRACLSHGVAVRHRGNAAAVCCQPVGCLDCRSVAATFLDDKITNGLQPGLFLWARRSVRPPKEIAW